VAEVLVRLEIPALLVCVFGAEDMPTKLTLPSIQATGLARSARPSLGCPASKFLFSNANSSLI